MNLKEEKARGILIKMKISKRAIDFNKEMLFGEIGSFLGAQTFGLVFSNITSNINIISFSVIAGAILGAALFFLSARIYNQSRKRTLSRKKLVGDLL